MGDLHGFAGRGISGCRRHRSRKDQGDHLVVEGRETAARASGQGIAVYATCFSGGDFIAMMAALYAYVIWFQYWGPARRAAATP